MLILRKGGYSMVDKLLNDASYRSYWRGYEYFKEGRVKIFKDLMALHILLLYLVVKITM